MIIEELINKYANSGVSTPETRKASIFSFINWMHSEGYECHVKLTRAAAERKRDTLLAERDAIEEKLAAIEQELKQ